MIIAIAGLRAEPSVRRQMLEYQRRFIRMAKVLVRLPDCRKLILCQAHALHGIAITFWRDSGALSGWVNHPEHQAMVQYAAEHLDLVHSSKVGLWIEFYQSSTSAIRLGRSWSQGTRTGFIPDNPIANRSPPVAPPLLAVGIWDIAEVNSPTILRLAEYEAAIREAHGLTNLQAFSVAPSGRLFLSSWDGWSSADQWLHTPFHLSLAQAATRLVEGSRSRGALWIEPLRQIPGGIFTSPELVTPGSLASPWALTLDGRS